MYIYISIYIHTRRQVTVFFWIDKIKWLQRLTKQIYPYVYLYIQICIHMYVKFQSAYSCINVYRCVCMYIYKYIHTNTWVQITCPQRPLCHIFSLNKIWNPFTLSYDNRTFPHVSLNYAYIYICTYTYTHVYACLIM